MNENNQLEAHESILLMENASNGKSVSGTRVFKSFGELLSVYPNMKLVAVAGKVGDVVAMGTVRNTYDWRHPRNRAGQDYVTKVAQTGYRLEDQPYGQFYISSSTAPPKRFSLMPEHFGYPSYKEKTAYKKVT